MRSLLISPPYPLFGGETKFASPPLGLAYIAALLESKGLPVTILDCVVEDYENEEVNSDGLPVYGLSTVRTLEKIAEYAPNVVGISCLFSTVDSTVVDLTKAIKEQFPHIKTVLGGTHATVMAERIVRDPNVDYVVRGEGEYPFVHIIEYLEGRRPIEEVNNLTWCDADTVCHNPQIFVQDIDELPIPARHLLSMEGYIRIGRMQGVTKPGERATTMITSRGCPAKCSFCSIHSVWGRNYRGHSAEYVLREMEGLVEQYNVEHLLIEDDNLTFNKDRAMKIFEGMIERKLNVSWTTPNGVAMWALNPALIKVMRDSGCIQLFLAFESGVADTLLKVIKKPLRLDKAEKIAKECRKQGIRTHAFFVLGFPGETKELMRQSMEFAENVDVDQISIAVATPYPGTPLYEQCKELGYINEETFDVGRLMTRVGQIRTPEFDPKDVESLIAATYVRFALKHPLRTFRRLAARFWADPAQTFSFVVRRIGELKVVSWTRRS